MSASDAPRGGGGDLAVSQLTAILFGVVLLGSILSVAFLVAQTDEHERGKRVALEARSENALAVLTLTPGEPEDWARRPQGILSVERLGLLSEGRGARVLDPGKVEALRNAAPSHVDVVKRALGAPEHHVRLRIEPSYFPFPNGTVVEIASLRAAYVAHYSGDAKLTKKHSALATESVVAESERRLVRETGAGFEESLASVVAHVGRGDRHPDSQVDLRHDLVPRLAGFDSATYAPPGLPSTLGWKVVTRDHYHDGRTGWWDVGTPSRLLATGNWDGTRFRNTERTQSLTVGLFDVSDLGPGWDGMLTLRHWLSTGALDEALVVARCLDCPAPADVVLWDHLTASDLGRKDGFVPLEATLSEESVGGSRFLLRLEYTNVLPGSAPRPPGVPAPTDGEGWFVSYLALNVTGPAGTATAYENRLDYRTSRYDALVVGSAVDHVAFRTGDRVVQSAVNDWVKAGGRLLVLGSSNVQDAGGADASAWMEGNYTAGGGTSSAVSGLLAGRSDLSHPLVRAPHPLVHAAAPRSTHFDDHAYTPSSNLAKVLVGRTQSGSDVDLLAVSTPAAFEGAVVLTSATPGRFPDADDPGGEAFRALVNWLAYLARHEAHVDFGESVPANTPYGHASAQAAIDRLDGEAPWPVGVTAFVWR